METTVFPAHDSPELNHLPELLAAPIASLSSKFGIPSDQILLISCLLLAVIFGWVHRFVPSQIGKHVTNILIGASFCYIIVGSSSLHMLTLSSMVYLYVNTTIARVKQHVLSIASTNKEEMYAELRSKLSSIGYTVFIFSMGYLSFSHIYRMYVDYMGWRVDFTAPLMVLTLKMISYAWNRIDGELLAFSSHTPLDDYPKEASYRKQRAILPSTSTLNSFLNFFGWVFFFPGVIAGPMIEHNEYSGHIDGSLYQNRFGINNAPFSWTAPLKKVGMAVLVYPGILLASKFPVAGFVATPAFYEAYPSRLMRFLYVNFLPTFSHWKYYFIWLLAEASCVSSGMGLSRYEVDKGKVVTEWEACSNCDIPRCEFPSTIAEFANSWNIRVAAWLKHTIYLRIEDVPSFLQGKLSVKSFANIGTKMTSAFWHGFYPGYYLFFFQAWVVQEAEALVRLVTQPIMETVFPLKKTDTKNETDESVASQQPKTVSVERGISVIRPSTKKPAKYNMNNVAAVCYDFVMRVIILMSMNYSGISFFLLGFSEAFEVYSDVYFSYHILVFLGMVFVLPKLRKKAKLKRLEKLEKLEKTNDVKSN